MNDTEHTVECPYCKTLIKQSFFRIQEFYEKCQEFFGCGIDHREKPMTPPDYSSTEKRCECNCYDAEYDTALGTWVCCNCRKIRSRMIRIAAPAPNKAHYESAIEPFAYIRANNLDFFEGNVVKYVTRWRKKGGLDDLRKARVYIDELIRQEEAK